MADMRFWIDLVEAIASKSFIERISADTEENREHAKHIEQLKREIEAEEQLSSSVPPSVMRVPKLGTEEWDAHSAWLDYELEQHRKKAQQDLEAQKRIEKQEQDARIQGVQNAAQDAMADLIAKDRAIVSKLANQALKAQQADGKRVRKQALKQIKK